MVSFTGLKLPVDGRIVSHWTNDAIELQFKAMITKQKRPKFLNILRIRLPVTGVNSFAHRVSGALLFLSVPLFIYCFNLSIRDAMSFEQLQNLLASPVFKTALTILAWAIGHHMLAGIRFLLTEVGVATSLDAARRFAWIVNVLGVIIFLLAGYCIWI
jgi:succinate dehydrogenase / fumarate reductase cytochrome b subunit